MALSQKDISQPNVQRGAWARFVTALMGVWVLLSAFALSQPYPLGPNARVVGLGVFLTGLWALRDAFARWLSAALAIWLVGITLFVPEVPIGTLCNNIAAGVIIVLLSWVASDAT